MSSSSSSSKRYFSESWADLADNELGILNLPKYVPKFDNNNNNDKEDTFDSNNILKFKNIPKYDPYLDNSKDGLPLLFKTSKPFEFTFASTTTSISNNNSTSNLPETLKSESLLNIKRSRDASELNNNNSTPRKNKVSKLKINDTPNIDENYGSSSPTFFSMITRSNVESSPIPLSYNEVAKTQLKFEVIETIKESNKENDEDTNETGFSVSAMLQAEEAVKSLMENMKNNLTCAIKNWKFTIPQELAASWSDNDWNKFLSRQKQIELGKQTPEYQTYCSTISKNKRTKKMPSTPLNDLKASKRNWTVKISDWRRNLHALEKNK